jgi:Uma2 family endonuclease
MTVRAQPRRYTLEEYFEIEHGSPEKHEFRNGEIINLSQLIGMAGGAVAHSLITINFAAALRSRLKGGPCRVYSSDLRVRTPRKTLYSFPDATVICGKAQIETIPGVGETATNPQVIVEVLSPSTEAYDRGDKFARYREFDTLREYVLISQHEARVEVFLRSEDGLWAFAPYSGIEATAKLRSLNVDLPLAEVFDGVEFPPPEGPGATGKEV